MKHFPDSPLQPPYTAAWRTGYSTPEGGTYEGEGIGKRLALAGIADVVALTMHGLEYEEKGDIIALPSLQEGGIWLDTGVGNIDGRNLYHHLGNTSRDEEPIGFKDVGIYVPDPEEGMTPQQLEPRVGMVADSEAVRQLVVAAGILLDTQV